MTPYYMEPNAEDWMRKRMDTYGAICRELAEKYGCCFIDLQAVFNDYFNTAILPTLPGTESIQIRSGQP